MSVWLTIPSKRPPEEAEKVLKLWRERGYKIALCRDEGENNVACDFFDCILPYPGYASAVNHLIGCVLSHDPSAEWFIAAGDDVQPDLHHSAEEIAAQCREYFRDNALDPFMATWGVMQPTGDRWGDTLQSRQMYGADRGAYIDRVCGSAWIGREFALRVNQGRGPLWPEYFHMYVDEELFHVATKLGVLWQRRDLIHLHQHWGRGPANQPNQLQDRDTRMPEFLRRANSREEWDKANKLFEARKAAGFPGSEVL